MRLTVFCAGLASDWHNPSARSLRSLLRALAARGHEVLIWELTPNPFLSAELRACGSAHLRAFAARFGDLQRHTFPAMRGQNLTLWLSRTLATAEVGLVDARLPVELVRKVGQFTSAGLVTLLYDATGEALAGGEPWWAAAGVAGYNALAAGSAALAADYRARGAERVAVLAPAADPAALQPVGVPTADVALLAEGALDTPALLALADLVRALPDRTFLLAGDGDGAAGDAAIQATGIQREPPCARRTPEAVYPLARLALHVPAGPLHPSARPLEALACRTPVAVLAADAGDLAGLDAGLIAAPTAAELAGAVEQVLTDEPARLARAAAGHAAVLAQHTSAARAADLEALLSHE